MADDTGLRRRGAGWEARVTYHDMSGKQRTLSATCRTKSEARAKRDEFRALRASGQNLGSGRESLKHYLGRWIDRREERGGLSPATLAGYRGSIDRYIVPHIGGLELRKITPEHVELWLDRLGDLKHYRTGDALSPQTRHNAFRVLHKALEDALRKREIASNPCHLVEPLRLKRGSVNSLSAQEVKTLLEALKTKGPDSLYIAALIAVSTGLRRGEVLALRWQDIDLERSEATISRQIIPVKGGTVERTPKSEASRAVIPLPAATVAALKARKTRQTERRLEAGSMWQDGGFIVDNGFGASISPSYLTHSFSKAAKAAGLSVTFHGLRHTFTSLHHGAGTPLKVLQELVRHSTPGLLLNRYAHTESGAHEAAAERLGNVLKEAL